MIPEYSGGQWRRVNWPYYSGYAGGDSAYRLRGSCLALTLADGWNSGDGDLFAKHFAEDADYMVWNGRYLKGKSEIAEGHNHLFNTFYKDTKQKIEVLRIRLLRDNVAVVHVQGGLVADDKEWPSVKPLFVMIRHDGEWQIDVFQNTPVAPHARNPNDL